MGGASVKGNAGGDGATGRSIASGGSEMGGVVPSISKRADEAVNSIAVLNERFHMAPRAESSLTDYLSTLAGCSVRPTQAAVRYCA